MGAGQSGGVEIGGSSMGYQVLRVYPNSPGSRAGLKAYFDFIIAIGNTRFNKENGSLREILKASVDQKLKMIVFNTRTRQTREVEIIPSTSWGGNGLLGVSIKHSSFDRADERVWHVLEVQPGSPAQQAGFIAEQDYVIGSDSILQENDDLYNLIETHEGKALKLFVYNVVNDNCREVICHPNSKWGGQGYLGCEFGHGLMHRIPFGERGDQPARDSSRAPLLRNEQPMATQPIGQNNNSYTFQNQLMQRQMEQLQRSNQPGQQLFQQALFDHKPPPQPPVQRPQEPQQHNIQHQQLQYEQQQKLLQQQQQQLEEQRILLEQQQQQLRQQQQQQQPQQSQQDQLLQLLQQQQHQQNQHQELQNQVLSEQKQQQSSPATLESAQPQHQHQPLLPSPPPQQLSSPPPTQPPQHKHEPSHSPLIQHQLPQQPLLPPPPPLLQHSQGQDHQQQMYHHQQPPQQYQDFQGALAHNSQQQQQIPPPPMQSPQSQQQLVQTSDVQQQQQQRYAEPPPMQGPPQLPQTFAQLASAQYQSPYPSSQDQTTVHNINNNGGINSGGPFGGPGDFNTTIQ